MYSSELLDLIPIAYKAVNTVLEAEGEDSVFEIVRDALNSVEGHLRRQDKNRDKDALNPTRPVFDEAATFQYYLYHYLELAEKAQERLSRAAGARLNERTMILRYLKCIVYNCANRRPYYLAVGIGSLLYDYDDLDTASIHDVVIQEADDSKTQNKRNARLRELKIRLLWRFRRSLPHSVDGNRAIKFHLQRATDGLFDVTQAALRLLVPWGSEHVIPRHTPADTRSFPSLQIGRDEVGRVDRSQAMSVWKNRSHALIDPDCFSRLVDLLGIGPLRERLRIPAFAFSQSVGGQGGPPPSAPGGDEGPSAHFYQKLFNEKDRRDRRQRHLRAGMMSVMVDGSMHPFDVEEESSFRCTALATTKVIKLIAADASGDLPLATLPINLYSDDLEEDGYLNVEATLKHGQKIAITVAPDRTGGGQVGLFSVEVTYRETQWARAISLWFRRSKRRLSHRSIVFDLRLTAAEKIAVTIVLSFAVIAFAAGYVLNRQPSPFKAQQNPSPTPQTAHNTPTPEVAREIDNRNGASPDVARQPTPDQSPSPTATPSPTQSPAFPSPRQRVEPHKPRTAPTPAANESVEQAVNTTVTSLDLSGRASGVPPAIPLPHHTLVFRLEFEDADGFDYGKYNARLIENATGRVVWRWSAVRFQRSGSRRTLNFPVMTAGIREGGYTLQVAGVGHGGSEVDKRILYLNLEKTIRND
jgi:hypothetical protein